MLASVERCELSGYKLVSAQLTAAALADVVSKMFRDNGIHLLPGAKTAGTTVLDCPDEELPVHLVESGDRYTSKEIAIWRLKNLKEEN